MTASAAIAAPATCLVPGGTFLMGSSDGLPDEAPPHAVTVRAFRLARTPVTNAEYARFLAARRAPAPPFWSNPAYADPEQPVVAVTWMDAVAYADWLSARTGLRFRLPSEAEWERAARGGRAEGRTAWGDEVPAGEIPTGPLNGPWCVGKGTPNAYGLLDISTIVHEWCLDWYSPTYYASCARRGEAPRSVSTVGSGDTSSPAVDPRGPDEGERRASRGGSWRHRVRYTRPAARSSLLPHLRYADYGFRLLQEID
jgi:formylglycine-generating enzyme required for sulfatase activity